MGHQHNQPYDSSQQGPWAEQFWAGSQGQNPNAQSAAAPSGYGQGDSASNERTFATFCHLGVYLGWSILPVAGFFLGPMIVWLLKKDESAFADHHGREAMNFQISCILWMLISIPLCLIGVGFITFILAALASLLMPIYAALKAADGQWYKYPLTWRFI
jgi:hypothetical protein